MVTLHTPAQHELFLAILKECHVSVDPTLVPHILSKATEMCLLSETEANITPARMRIYVQSSVLNTPNAFSEEQNHTFRGVYRAITYSVFIAHEKGNMDSFNEIAARMLRAVSRNGAALCRDSMNTYENSSISQALIIGAALFASTMMVERSVRANELREQMDFTEADARNLTKGLSLVFDSRKEFRGELSHPGK